MTDASDDYRVTKVTVSQGSPKKKKKAKPPDWYGGPEATVAPLAKPIPTTSFARDMSNIYLQGNQTMVGINSVAAVRNFGRGMMPLEMDSFQAWAAGNPTSDPRVWSTAAMALIYPDDPAGLALAQADELRQIDEGTRGQVRGEDRDPGGANTKRRPKGFWGKIGGAFDTGTDWADDLGGHFWDTAQTMTRTNFAAIGSLWQAPNAANRVIEGSKDRKRKIAEKFGLSNDEMLEAFPDLIEGEDLEQAQASARGLTPYQPRQGRAKITDPDRRRLIRKAQQMAQANPNLQAKQQFKNFAEQISIYQTLRDPKTALDKRGGWFEHPVIEERQAQATITAYDLRSEQQKTDYDTYMARRSEAFLAAEAAGLKPMIEKVALEIGASGQVVSQTVEQVERASVNKALEDLPRGVSPQAWTLGRGIAAQHWDLDSSAYHLVSGTIDFAASAGLDPANAIPALPAVKLAGKAGKGADALLASKVASKIRADKLRPVIPGALARAVEAGQDRVLVKGELRTPDTRNIEAAPERARVRGKKAIAEAQAKVSDVVFDPALATKKTKAGLPVVDPVTGRVRGPHGLAVVPERAWMWLNGGQGQKIVAKLVEATSASEIHLLSNGGFGLSLSKQLADATTGAEVRALLGTRMGMELNRTSQFGEFGRRGISTIKNNSMRDSKAANWFRYAPRGGVFDGEDHEVVFEEITAWGRGIGLKWEQVRKHLDDYYAAPTGAGRYQALYGEDDSLMSTARQYLTDRNVPDDVAHTLTKAFKGGMNANERGTWEARGGLGAMGLAADERDIPKVLFEHEQLGRMLMLPQYKDMKRAANIGGRITRQFGPNTEKAKDIAARAAQGTTTMWRNATLIRGAYVLRELIDLHVSASLGGYSGLFTHPIDAIAMTHNIAMMYPARSGFGKLNKALLTGTTPSTRMEHYASRRRLLREQARTGARTPGGRKMTRRGTALERAALAGKAGAFRTAAAPVGTVTAMNDLRRKMVDYLTFEEGASRLAPTFNRKLARLNGEEMTAALQRYMDTGDPGELGHLYDGMNAAHGNFLMDERAQRVRSIDTVPYSRDDPAHLDSYARGIGDLIFDMSRDRDMRRIADADLSQDDIIEAFRADSRALKMEMRPDLLDDLDPSLDVKYLENYATAQRKITLGDDELREAVRTGKFADEAIGPKNKAFINKIKELATGANKNEMLATVGVREINQSTAADWTEKIGRFFDVVGEMTDLMARGPITRQIYAREAIRLGDALTPAAKAQAVKNLREAGDIKLARQVMAVQAKGEIDIETMEAILEGSVRMETKRLFYDASRRQNWSQAMRVVWPFAQATANTYKRWGAGALRNPQMAYRVIKPIEALMDPDSAFLYELLGTITGDETMQSYYTPGHPEDSVNGFFFTDPTYADPATGDPGEVKFAYPVVGKLQAWMASQATGYKVGGLTAEARASSLNVAGASWNFGMGPLVTLAASTFLADDWGTGDTKGKVLRAAFPYGMPEGNPVAKVWDSFAPTWAQKLAQADDGPYTANMAMKLMPSLISQGDYDLSKRSDQTRLIADAKQIASMLYGTNAIFGSLTPTTFNTAISIALSHPSKEDPHAPVRWGIQYRIAQEFKRYTKGKQGEDYDAARRAFVTDFGLGAMLSVLPITKSADQLRNIPTPTNDVWHFQAQAPEAYESYKSVIGLFFSGDDIGSSEARTLSPEFSRAQRARGERRYLSTQEVLDRADDTLGWMIYNTRMDELDSLDLDDDMRAVKRAQIREEIHNTFRSWTGGPRDPEQYRNEIVDLEEAVQDEDIRTLPSAPAITIYLKARREAIAILQERGISGDDLGAKGARDMADALREMGIHLAQQDRSGGFRNAWSRLFENELEAR